MQSLKKIFFLISMAIFCLPAYAQYSGFDNADEQSQLETEAANSQIDADDALENATPVDSEEDFLDDVDFGDDEVMNTEVGNQAEPSQNVNNTTDYGSNNLYNNQSQTQGNSNQTNAVQSNNLNQQNSQQNSQSNAAISDFAPQQVTTQENALQSNQGQSDAEVPAQNNQVLQQQAPADIEEDVPVDNETGFETVPAEQTFTPNIAPMADVPAPAVDSLPQPNEFSGAPPLPGTRREMADGEAPIEYIVQPGDTLFDICDQLLDEPYYWPKLWSFNPQIKNPHFIYPGMVLKFYTGNANQPPYMEIVQSDEELPVDRDGLNPAELVAQQDIPEVADSESVAGDTLSEPTMGADELDIAAIEGYFMESGTIYSDPTIHLTIPAFIFSDQKETVGEVIGSGEGHGLSGPEDEVIIRSESGVNAGVTYTVIRKGNEVVESGTKEEVGYFYEFVGNIKIEKKLNTDPLYLAKAERALMIKGIRSGDLLIPFISTQRQISSKDDYGRVVTLEGATILTFDQPESQFGGRGNFVFINRGNGQLAEGDAVKLYSRYGHTATKDLIEKYPNVDDDYKYVGIARIVDVTDAAALGFIMDSIREARVGDPAGR